MCGCVKTNTPYEVDHLNCYNWSNKGPQGALINIGAMAMSEGKKDVSPSLLVRRRVVCGKHKRCDPVACWSAHEAGLFLDG